MDNKSIIIKRIVNNAIVLALYVILSFLSYLIPLPNIQFRIAEILVLLCFFNRDYIIGITLGCLLSNLYTLPQLPFDFLIGTSATILSCLLISFSKHLGIASIFPILFNSFIIGAETYHWLSVKPYMLAVGFVAIGEATVIIIGYIVFMIFMKKDSIKKLINANRNLDFKW